MTPAEFRTARQALGLSLNETKRLMRVECERTVRRWEAGERSVPGPVGVLMALLQRSAAVRRMLGVEDPPAA